MTRWSGAVLLFLLTFACVSAGRLGEYDFRDRSVNVVTTAPPRPQVFTSDFFGPGGGGWLGELVRIGTEIAKEETAAEARDKLDEAVTRVDVAGLMADRVLERGARLLRARPVETSQEAEFELEIRIEDYGIEADSWDAQANFFIQAEVFLFDALAGERIWKAGVDESDPINPGHWGSGGGALGNIVTAQALAGLSVEEIETALESLAIYAGDRMTEKLEESLEKARRDRSG